jgi:hypothetical protein
MRDEDLEAEIRFILTSPPAETRQYTRGELTALALGWLASAVASADGSRPVSRISTRLAQLLAEQARRAAEKPLRVVRR